MGELLRITQQELAYLVGLSRQRVNLALATLHEQGLIEVTIVERFAEGELSAVCSSLMHFLFLVGVKATNS